MGASLQNGAVYQITPEAKVRNAVCTYARARVLLFRSGAPSIEGVSITEIERLHKERLLRLRQLQKELTLQNRAFVAWTRKPNDVTITSKWRTQRKLVEQAGARYTQAQEAYLSAVIRKGLTLP